MNIGSECLLLAHAGGRFDPRSATVFGCVMIVVGALMFLRDTIPRRSKTKSNGVYFGAFLILLGYITLADGQNLAGRQVARQLLMWWMALPIVLILLVLPRILWKYRQFLRQRTTSASLTSTHSDASPVDEIRRVLRTGESLLWWGVPSPGRFLRESIASVILGMIFLALISLFLVAMGWGVIRNGINRDMLPGYLIGGFAGLGFLTIGIIFVVHPWKLRSRLQEVVDAITDQRAIVLTGPQSFWNPVPAMVFGETSMEFSPDQIRHYKKKWVDFGRTDLIFAREWREGRRGGRWIDFGFMGLNDPDEPERVIKAHYLASTTDSMPRKG
jgi:hypothetical protein